MHGNPVEVTGNEMTVGSTLPDITLTGPDLADVQLKASSGKVLVLSVVPSLDTPICALQTKRFNSEAAKLSKDVEIITVSRDLPFAQKRWCGAEGADQLTVLSDYKHRTFGQAFGVDMEAAGLLARAVFVFGKDSTAKLVQYVDEVTEEPNYDEVLKAVAGELD